MEKYANADANWMSRENVQNADCKVKRFGNAGLVAQLRDFGAGPIIGMCISMLTVPVTTRLVSPEEFGRSSLFTLMQTIFNFIVLLGIDQSYVRYYNENSIDKRNLLFNSLLLPFFTCFLVVLAVLVFGKQISFFMFGQFEPLIMFSFLIFLPALMLNRFALLSIRMELRGKAYSFLNVIQQVINFLVLVALLYLYERSFRSIVLAMILSTIISTVMAVIMARFFSSSYKYYVDKELMKKLILFGLPLVPASVLSWLLNSCDKVALRTMSSFGELGLYAAAFKIVAILSIFQNIFTTTWTPVAYKWYEQKVPNKKFEDVSTIVLAMMTIAFSLVVIFRNIIMLFLGSEYRNTTDVFVFLLFVPVMYTVSETTCLGIGFAGKTIYTLYISLISAVLNVLGIYLLVPKYGAIGAAVSTCLCYIVFFWARTLFSRMVWFKLKLGKYFFNILLLLLFGINMLFWETKAIEIAIFVTILLFNSYLMLRVFQDRKLIQEVYHDIV